MGLFSIIIICRYPASAHIGWSKTFEVVNDMNNSGQELSLSEIQIYFKSKPEHVNFNQLPFASNLHREDFFLKIQISHQTFARLVKQLGVFSKGVTTS